MGVIKNICKHNTFFKLVSSEEWLFIKQENKKVWKSIYESNEIHNHQVDEKLINYIKPFLYYLASKNINKKGKGSWLNTSYEVGVCWKNMYGDDGYYYQGIIPWVVMIDGKDGLTMKVISNEHNYEGETPFKIELVIYQSYYLSTISKPFNSDQCVVCLTNKPELLFINCLHRCVCLKCEETNPFHKCPSCRTDISIKVKI